MILKQKDMMWNIKSTLEIIMMIIAVICFIGFVFTMVMCIIAIPMVWNKPIGYQPFPWLNPIMGCSIGIGLVNMLVMLSCDKEWRRDYRDNEDEEEFD